MNLDPMLELAHFSQNIRVRAYSAADSGVVASFLKSGDEPEHARNLIYLHGRYSDSIDRIALTKDGYDILYKQEAFSTLMTALAATRRIVFLGFGFEDKRVLSSFEKTTSSLGDVTLCHYAILPFDESKADGTERERYRALWNVEVIYYDKTPGHPDGSHSQFAALMQELSIGLNVRHVPTQVVTPPAIVQPPGNLDTYLDSINGPNLATLRGKMMFRIDRTGVVDEIAHTLRERSVVATGAPGVGKSWLLAEIHDRFKHDNYRVLVLPAESYDVDSLDELQRRLGLPTDIVSFLNALGDRVLLLVDGLDALRAESSSETFRQLLEWVHEGAPKCRVLVSVRTFDLEQSPRLRSLFMRGNYKTIYIAELNDLELESACLQAPQLRYLLLTAREMLRKLLRNPFMLRLALRLLDFGISYEVIGQDTSEVQLLARFWNRRIEMADHSSSKLRLLKSVVDMMSDAKLLSISLPTLLPRLETKELADAFAFLQSDEILKEQLDRVAFSHNILFDYAASRLILTRESLFWIIRDDASLAIFLRPSISYYLTSMWIFEPAEFWTTFWRISDPQNDFRERQCTLLANVIVDNLKESTDLAPAFGWPRSIKVRALRAVLRSLTNESFVTRAKRERWISVIFDCLDAMEPEYVQEIVRLTANLSELSSRREIEKVTHLARRMLNWSWNEAEKPNSLADPIALTTMITGRLLPTVLENYKTAAIESREMVVRLLSQFGKQNASPKNAFYLAWGIKPIIDADPDTAEAIVKAIFSYEEHSLERTDIGGGSISRFTSTRKQDYDQAFYALQQQYSYFVEVAPLHALRAALVAVNKQVRREHLEGKTNNDSFEFQYKVIHSRYQADWSEIWDGGHAEANSLSLLDICLRHLLSDGIEQPLPFKTVLVAIAQYNEVAVVWRHVFFPFLSDSSEMIEAIIPLLEVPSFLSAPEITRTIGNYIERIYIKQAPSESQRRRIEQAILALKEFEPSIFRYEQQTETTDRLLARIPVDGIVTEEGLSLRKSLEHREEELENQPFHRLGFMQGGPMNEEFLEMRGIDTKSPSRLLNAIKAIRNFSSSYVNSIPSAEEVNAVLIDVRHAWDCLREDDQEDDVSTNAAGTIAAAAAAIAKSDKIPLNSEALRLSREILLGLATHSQPIPQPNADEAFDHPGWGSPSTRIEVAEG